jgi:hypothetical protein
MDTMTPQQPAAGPSQSPQQRQADAGPSRQSEPGRSRTGHDPWQQFTRKDFANLNNPEYWDQLVDAYPWDKPQVPDRQRNPTQSRKPAQQPPSNTASIRERRGERERQRRQKQVAERDKRAPSARSGPPSARRGSRTGMAADSLSPYTILRGLGELRIGAGKHLLVCDARINEQAAARLEAYTGRP